MPAGQYQIIATSKFQHGIAAAYDCGWRFTTGSINTSTQISTSSGQFDAVNVIEGTLFVPTDFGATTIKIQSKAGTASRTCTIAMGTATGSAQPNLDIQVYYFPSFGGAKSDTIFSDLDGDTRINVDGDGSDSDNMTFFTAGTERMVIKNDGKVGIGTTSPDEKLHSIISSTTQFEYVAKFENTGNSANTDGILVKLGVTGNPGTSNNFIQFSDADTLDIGAIEGNGAGGITLFSASDERLKENIRETQYGLKDLAQIQVSDFNFIGSDASTTGFIAQQLYGIYPLAVSVGGEDELKEPWKVSHSSLAPLLVKAIQEQQSQIETLQSQNYLLKSELCSRDASYSWC